MAATVDGVAAEAAKFARMAIHPESPSLEQGLLCYRNIARASVLNKIHNGDPRAYAQWARRPGAMSFENSWPGIHGKIMTGEQDFSSWRDAWCKANIGTYNSSGREILGHIEHLASMAWREVAKNEFPPPPRSRKVSGLRTADVSALNSAMLTAEANRDVRGLSIGLQAIKAPWVAPALREGKRHMAEQEAQRLQQERIARAAEVGGSPAGSRESHLENSSTSNNPTAYQSLQSQQNAHRSRS